MCYLFNRRDQYTIVLKIIQEWNLEVNLINVLLCNLSTAIHIVAHVFNVEFFIDSHKSEDRVIQTLNNMEDIGNETYLNPIREMNAVSRIAEWPVIEILCRRSS